MKNSFLFLFVVIALFSAACQAKQSGDGGAANSSPSSADDGAGLIVPSATATATQTANASSPKTVRDFFMALPEKYFYAESCDKAKDKDCQAAKRDYLKTYLEVDDAKNGYLKAGCDGAQSCIEMAIFRKPDNSYMIAVATTAEVHTDEVFLEIRNGNWVDVSKENIPDHGSDKIYQIPRQGTTMSVFEKKVIEKGDDYEIAEKGKKLYDLVWKDGKFSRQ